MTNTGNINPDRINFIVDGSFSVGAVYVDGNLYWTRDADEVLDVLVDLTGIYTTDGEDDMDTLDAIDAYTDRTGIFIEQQGTVTPTGYSHDVPSTLAEVYNLG